MEINNNDDSTNIFMSGPICVVGPSSGRRDKVLKYIVDCLGSHVEATTAFVPHHELEHNYKDIVNADDWHPVDDEAQFITVWDQQMEEPKNHLLVFFEDFNIITSRVKRDVLFPFIFNGRHNNIIPVITAHTLTEIPSNIRSNMSTIIYCGKLATFNFSLIYFPMFSAAGRTQLMELLAEFDDHDIFQWRYDNPTSLTLFNQFE